jgi:hypothetical protein
MKSSRKSRRKHRQSGSGDVELSAPFAVKTVRVGVTDIVLGGIWRLTNRALHLLSHFVGRLATAGRSSLSAPRITIFSASSGNGRCRDFASSHGARIQTSLLASEI